MDDYGRWGKPYGGREGPLGASMIRRVESLGIEPGSEADVMASAVVQLARSADAAASRGQAAAVGAATREIREALTRMMADLGTSSGTGASSVESEIAAALRAPDASPCGVTPSLIS